MIPNPEAGILLVRTTTRRHREVQAYLDDVLASARRQVLVEATIVEVELSDRFQAGVDWERLAGNSGIGASQSLLADNLAAPPFFLLSYRSGSLGLTVRLLEEFGKVQVLSSPKLVVLNNQTAVLKAMRNIVYFEVNVETASGTDTAPGIARIDTDTRTAPEGIMLAVTPHVSHADEIVLNVRPTITRVNRFVNDPQPELAAAGVTNPVPELLVREMESVLRLNSGQTAILGGLMQDSHRGDTNRVPGLSEVEPHRRRVPLPQERVREDGAGDLHSAEGHTDAERRRGPAGLPVLAPRCHRGRTGADRGPADHHGAAMNPLTRQDFRSLRRRRGAGRFAGVALSCLAVAGAAGGGTLLWKTELARPSLVRHLPALPLAVMDLAPVAAAKAAVDRTRARTPEPASGATPRTERISPPARTPAAPNEGGVRGRLHGSTGERGTPEPVVGDFEGRKSSAFVDRGAGRRTTPDQLDGRSEDHGAPGRLDGGIDGTSTGLGFYGGSGSGRAHGPASGRHRRTLGTRI